MVVSNLMTAQAHERTSAGQVLDPPARLLMRVPPWGTGTPSARARSAAPRAYRPIEEGGFLRRKIVRRKIVRRNMVAGGPAAGASARPNRADILTCQRKPGGLAGRSHFAAMQKNR